MNSHRIKKHVKQEGILLIEALMAIVIFALGVLALIGLQTSSVQQSTDAKYRSDAILLADQLIGQMWVSDRTETTLQTKFSGGQNGSSGQSQGGNSTDGTQYTAWLGGASQPGTVLATLPNASNHPPLVTISPMTGTTSAPATSLVTITLYWTAPYGKNPQEHQYTVKTQINAPYSAS
jgi:type IV pilus assembly protein PilV